MTSFKLKFQDPSVRFDDNISFYEAVSPDAEGEPARLVIKVRELGTESGV